MSKYRTAALAGLIGGIIGGGALTIRVMLTIPMVRPLPTAAWMVPIGAALIGAVSSACLALYLQRHAERR